MLKSLSFFFYSALFIFFCVVQFNCSPQSEDREMSNEDFIERGEYLVDIGGCNHCHSPKTFGPMGMRIDSNFTLSGHPANGELPYVDTSMISPGKWYLAGSHLTAWVGPWGVSFAANLTPDGPTGLGNWTEEIFIKSMKTGKQMGAGRPILPPMPYEDIAKLNDEDLKAIFRYLKSLKPVSNQVPEPIPPNMIAEKLGKKKKK